MTGIAPWILVRDAAEALAFYRTAFGAIDLESHDDGTGVLQVAQLWIGGADFWIQTDTGATAPASPPVHMVLSIDEPDAGFAGSIAAGATEINPMSDAYGWRIGKLADPFGHQWEIGKRLDG